MQIKKLNSIVQKSVNLLLWTLVPILISFVAWQLILPAPISVLNIPEAVKINLSQSIKNSGWFKEVIVIPEAPVEVVKKKVDLNNDFNLLGVFLRHKKPAMAIVKPKKDGNSEVITQGKKSKLGLTLLNANDPFEIEVEDSLGNRSLMRIAKYDDLNSLYKKGDTNTELSGNSQNKVAEVNTNLVENGANTYNAVNTENNYIQPVQPEYKQAPLDKKQTGTTKSGGGEVRENNGNLQNNEGYINLLLSRSRGFSSLSQEKQSQIRDILSNTEIFESMNNDQALFDGLIESYKQLD